MEAGLGSLRSRLVPADLSHESGKKALFFFIKASLQTALDDESFLQRAPSPGQRKVATSMFKGAAELTGQTGKRRGSSVHQCCRRRRLTGRCN